MNVPFYAYDRGPLVVQLRTAFVHFAAFKIIFRGFPKFPGMSGSGFLNSRQFGRTVYQIPGNLGLLQFSKFPDIWENRSPRVSNGNLARRGLREAFVKNRSRVSCQKLETGFVTWLRQGRVRELVS